jgi:hypothetical protein
VIGGIASGVLIAAARFFVVDRHSAGPALVIAVTCGAIIAVLVGYFLRGKTTNPWFLRRRERLAVRKYQKHWRGQTLRFVQNTQYQLEEIQPAIAAAVQYNPGMFTASTWLPGLLPHDYGLAFYTLAHLHVR